MKVTVAAFQTKHGSVSIISISESGTTWADKDEGYVRLTHNLEIELEDLAHEEVVAARLKTLDASEEKIKADFYRAIAHLKDQREKLLALPNHVSEQS
jgi:hypothetical protein